MKKIVLSMVVVLMAGSVAAQSLQNFEYSPFEDEYPIDLTGGESFTQEINFTSEADQSLPFGLRVTVENDTTDFETGDLVGAEFDLTGSLEDSRTERSLVFENRLNDGDLVYIGSIDADNGSLGAFSENSLDVSVEADPAISPDSFDFEFDVRSAPGFAEETESTEINDTTGEAEVSVGESSVYVSSDAGESVAVESYSETTVSPPEPDREFVSGVGVEVQDSNGDEAEANGTVSIGYSQDVVEENNLDESSMDVYYYNNSLMEWTTEGVEVVSRDTADNVVEADVAHFSTYAAFAEQQDDSTDTDDGGGDVIPFDPAEDDEETESDTQEQTEESSEQDDSSGDQQEDTTTQDDETSGQEDTGVEDSEQDAEDQTDTQQTPDTPTGQFFTSDTGIAGGLLILLVVLVVYLEYTGRIELRELKEVIKQKTSN